MNEESTPVRVDPASATASTGALTSASAQVRAFAANPHAGDVFRVRYPFVREDHQQFTGDGDLDGSGYVTTIKSWKPGVKFVEVGCREEPDVDTICEAEGYMVLTVVDTFKPGRFPTRVFYTRQWIDPDGKTFGKGKLHITTGPAFTRRATSYMHEYRVAPHEVHPSASASLPNPQPNEQDGSFRDR